MRGFIIIVGFAIGQWSAIASADIVNINSGVNGTPGVFGETADVEQFLAAGEYTFTLVNNIDGHASFHPDANYTGWSYNTPGSNWGTNYSFSIDDGDAGNDTRSVPPYAGPDQLGGGRFSGVANAEEAFEHAIETNALTLNVSIPFDQTIGFFFSDQTLTDNAGGVSIQIDQIAVPEPGACTMCAFGLLGFAFFYRRKRR